MEYGDEMKLNLLSISSDDIEIFLMLVRWFQAFDLWALGFPGIMSSWMPKFFEFFQLTYVLKELLPLFTVKF